MVLGGPIPARGLSGLLRERTQRSPDALAFRFLVDGEEEALTVTWAELARRAQAVAACLLDRGARGERALLLHPPGIDYVAAFLGCALSGVVAVPAYPPRFNRPMLRLRALVADANARFALTTPAVMKRLERQLPTEPELARLEWLTTDRAEAYLGAPLAGPDPDPDALAVLQYTSGSTSAPRGVMLAHRHLVGNAALLAECVQLTADDRIVSWLPPFHDMGLLVAIVGPTLTGVESTLMPPGAFLQRPARWLRAVSRHRGTISGGPDFGWDQCVRRVSDADLATLDLSCLRLAFTGAERVRPGTLERFAARFAPAGFRASAFRPCYGLAEATLAVSFTRGEALLEAVDTAALATGLAVPATGGRPSRVLAGSGTPLPGFEVLVVDPVLRAPRPAGEVGELWVRGPTVADGYWGKPEETERTFRATLATGGPEHLRSGDLGYVRDGQVFVTGRLKDLVVLRGQNHYPEDLELTAQEAHPRLRAGGGAAFAAEADGAERLVIVHEVDDPRDLPAREIAAAVRGAIGDAHELQVHTVVLVPAGGVPRTSSGKVQRGLCREQWLAGDLPSLSEAGPEAPASASGPPAPPELVRRVAALASEVLGVASVDPDDDFFALGGHSLLATQLLSRVHATLGVELPVRTLFEAPTPRSLAARVARGSVTPAPPHIPRLDRTGPLPLTFSQERMWYLHALDRGGSAYNVAAGVDVAGPLRTGLFERALQHVVAEHEVLRTSFPAPGGVPAPVIAPPGSPAATVPLPLEDTSDAADPLAEARSRMEALAAVPFDLSVGPLVRARLYRTGPTRHVFAVSIAHVVCDGWALGVLLSRLLEAYQALVDGRPPPSDPEAPQFVDFAAWHRGRLDEATIARDLAHWRRSLQGAPTLELPLDRPRPARPSRAGGVEPIAIGPEQMEAVRALAREQGTTPFMVVLAAFQALLHRVTGQDDFVIGVPIAGRNHLASERLIGSLVNTLPFRARIEPDATFAGHLRRVREVALDAYDHQELPFERLVADLEVERRGDRTPLFGVLFDYQNSPITARGVRGLTLQPLGFSRRASQFDLTLLVVDTELGHLSYLEYATDLLDAATVRRLGIQFVTLLTGALADPLTPVSRLPLLDASELREVRALSEEACAGTPPSARVIRRFETLAAAAPDRIAVVDQRGPVTYGELDALATRLASRLAALGAGPGSRVAVCLDRSRALVAALLAVLKARAAYVPLDPRYPPERIGHVLEDARPVVVVTEQDLRDRLPIPPGVTDLLLDPEHPDAGAGLPPLSPCPDDSEPGEVAYVIYTSGSTGRPKGVEVTDRGLSNFLTSMSREPGLRADDRLLAVTTVSFDIAGLELFLPLVTGACVHLAPAEVVGDPVRLARLIETSGAGVMQATPSTWRMLLQSGWPGAPGLVALCGGEVLSRELADALLPRCAALWNLYGPTETTVWSTLARVTAGLGPVPVGRPVAHNRIYVLDRHGELLPRGVAGEIHIGGVGVARGYLGRPDLTAARFVPDPHAGPGARMYRTGDVGRLLADGALEVTGRLDDQVKIRGHRVEPGEIESVLRQHPGVHEAVVVTRPSSGGDVRLVAYWVPERGASVPGVPELRELCRRKLPEVMVPSYFVPLEALPRTPAGKTDRRSLPAPLEGHAGGVERRVPPRDALETELALVWGEVLGTKVESVVADFFDLGGHSLLAARLFALIEERLGVALPVAALVEAPTVELLAARVRAARIEGGTLPSHEHLLAIRKGGARPPLFCVHGAGGHVLNLYEVGRLLAPDRPFYGIQARGVDGVSRPLSSIEEMARVYLEEVRAARPHGPYHLSGYCGGALVACEMARTLRAQGERVLTLAVIDIARPGLPRTDGRLARWRRALADETPAELARRAAAKLRRDLSTLWVTLRLAWFWLLGRIPVELRDEWLTRSFARVSAAYRPARYEGPIAVFRARDGGDAPAGAGPDLGWREVAGGGVRVYDVPGDHHSIAREPNVQVLAAQLEACLRTGEEQEGPAALAGYSGSDTPGRRMASAAT